MYENKMVQDEPEMMNEVRYYLSIIKSSMHPEQIPEEDLASGADNLKPLIPQYMVTAVKLPTGAIELTTNTTHIDEKIDYILSAYDDNMRLKTNPEVVLLNLLVV